MSRFVFAGNEIIPGTVVMTADGTITPKDDLRVILNISGGGTVSLSDGTDVTQRIELVNVSADTCSFTYKGTGGSTTASIYTNTGIRLLWVGSYWETSMSTAVTGIDDNSQPFAFNIDSLVKPDGVINLTGTDANGNPFDYGVGKLVTVANENNLVTGVEVKTSKTFNGKPVYKLTLKGTVTPAGATNQNFIIRTYTDLNIDEVVSLTGSYHRVNPWWYVNIPYAYGGTQSVAFYLYTDNINLNVIGLSADTYTYVCFMEYTKTSD